MVDDEYYIELGVSRTATGKEIKSAYRKLALQYHPDRGNGNDEKFKKIGEAYEVLSDPEKRARYDAVGKHRMQSGGPDMGGMNHEDMFANFFGSSMGGMGGMGGMPMSSFGSSHTSRSVEPSHIVKNLRVSLGDMCKGKKKSLGITRKIIDKTKITMCLVCKGNGIEVKMRQVGLGMVVQQQAECSNCAGVGTICSPDAMKSKQEVVNLNIYPGCPENIVFVFPNMTNDTIDNRPSGSLIFKVVYEPSDTFSVIDNTIDIELKKPIRTNLFESLTGFTRTITHPMGHEIKIISKSPIKPGRYCLDGQGIEIKHPSYSSKGDLYFDLDVEYPKSVNLDGDGGLSTILNQTPSVSSSNSDTQVECMVSPPRPKHDISSFVAHQNDNATKGMRYNNSAAMGNGGCNQS